MLSCVDGQERKLVVVSHSSSFGRLKMPPTTTTATQTIWKPSKYRSKSSTVSSFASVNKNTNDDRSKTIADEDDEMEIVPLYDSDDDESEGENVEKLKYSKRKRRNFLCSKKDKKRNASGARSSSVSDGDNDDNDSGGPPLSLPAHNFGQGKISITLNSDAAEVKRDIPNGHLIIGSQRMQATHPDSLRNNNPPTYQEQQTQRIRVRLDCDTLPQVTLFVGTSSDEAVEVRVILEDLRSRQRFDACVSKKWNIAEIRRLFCDNQRLNAEEFETLFESVDIPCRLDRTLADLGVSSVRLSKSTKGREDPVKSKIDYIHSLCNDTEFSAIRGEYTQICRNLDPIIKHILTTVPFDIFTCETLVYSVSYAIPPHDLLKKLIDTFYESSSDTETQNRILNFLLIWIDLNPQTILKGLDTFHALTSFLAATTTRSDLALPVHNTLCAVLDHFRAQYFTPDLLAELSSRIEQSLTTKDRPHAKGRVILEWLRKEAGFNLSDSQLLFHNLVLRGYLRTMGPSVRPSARGRYYFAEHTCSASTQGTLKNITETQPPEFAYQIALFLSNIFSKVNVPQEFSPTYHSSRCDEYLTTLAKLELWMRWEVLSQPTAKDRLKVLEWLIYVAEASLGIGSFGGADLVVSALDAAPVKRVKALWAALSAEKRATLVEVYKQVRPNDGYKGYHSAVANLVAVRSPVVPIVRVHVTEVANATTVGDEICWERLFFAAGPIKEVLSTQRVPYEPRFDKEVQRLVKEACLKGESLDDDKIYRASLAVESIHDQEDELKKSTLMTIVNGVDYVPLK